MKKIYTIICLFVALQVSAVTVSDVAGVFKGTLEVGSKSYPDKEIYVLPGTTSSSVTLVMPSVAFSSKNNDLVLVDLGMNSSGSLSAGSAAAYVKEISTSSLSSSSASFTLSIVTPAQATPAKVTFSGSKVTNKNYAITNGGFEGNWSSNEPTGWHSFASATGGFASFVTANTGQFSQQTDVRPGSTGSYSARLQSKTTLGVKANGNCTNGRINAGSMSADDAEGNFSFSDPSSSGYNTPFVGNPDSLVFWAKYVPGGGNVTDASNKARGRAVLTTNARYQDPETGNFASVRVAEATVNYPATSDKGWQRVSVAFQYTNLDPASVAYMLLTFSTNATAGGGNSTKKSPDNVYLDDAEMIYNHSLKSFTLDGTPVYFKNGKAETSLLFSDSEYTFAASGDGKGSKSFIGYDAQNNQVHVYVVADNYSQVGAYNVYTLQMVEPIRDTEYSYFAITCDNEPYSDGLFQGLTQSGEYTTRIPNTIGGDSIITMTLTVLPTYSFPTTAIINMDESYKWRGNTYENLVPGVYTYTDELKTKVGGCDSIYTLALTVKAIPYALSEQMTVCQNEEATWHNKTLQTSEAGTFTVKDELKSIYDTDSIITLMLTVLPTYSISESATIDMDKSYTWHGNTYENLVPGVYNYTDELKTVVGECDSIHTLTLTVNAIAYEFSEEMTACRNEEVTWRDKVLHTEQDGLVIVYDSLKSIYGKDSVYVLHLTVLPTYEKEETQLHYQADVFEWHGKVIQDLEAREEPYIYYDSLVTAAGCDSVHVLKLTITDTPVTYGEYEAAFCEGDEIEFEGTVYTEAFDGEVRVEELNVYGGDSIVRLHVRVLPVYTEEEYMSIIVGEDKEWEDWPLSMMPVGSTTLYAYYSTVDDCDSTLILHLTVNPIPLYTDDAMTKQRQQKVHKQLRNGQLFIIKEDETIYDILGNKLK